MSPETHSTLPQFDRSPLVEVALTVQYRPLEALHAVHAGLFWTTLRQQFPRVEEHSPLPLVEESFGTPGSVNLNIQVQTGDTLPVPRFWFLNAAGTELIQLQQDRFGRNWRKPEGGRIGGPEYPRYEYLRQKFKEGLQSFQGFVASEQLGDVSFTQCELSYVNEIEAPHNDISSVVNVNLPPAGEGLLSVPENVSVATRYVISGPQGNPIGRLHVQVQPVVRRPDLHQALLLTLTARGRPEGESLDDCLRILDIGHEWAVRGFTAFTTERMHTVWGRVQ